MKLAFKGLLVIGAFSCAAMAAPTRLFNEHMNRLREARPGLDNLVLSDRTIYGDSIREIGGIIERDGYFIESLPQDRDSWFLRNWNFVVLSKYIEGIFSGRGGDRCNSTEIDNLRPGLCVSYRNFENKIDLAIEDVKRHCAFINLYGVLDEIKRANQNPVAVERRYDGWKKSQAAANFVRTIEIDLARQQEVRNRRVDALYDTPPLAAPINLGEPFEQRRTQITHRIQQLRNRPMTHPQYNDPREERAIQDLAAALQNDVTRETQRREQQRAQERTQRIQGIRNILQQIEPIARAVSGMGHITPLAQQLDAYQNRPGAADDLEEENRIRQAAQYAQGHLTQAYNSWQAALAAENARQWEEDRKRTRNEWNNNVEYLPRQIINSCWVYNGIEYFSLEHLISAMSIKLKVDKETIRSIYYFRF